MGRSPWLLSWCSWLLVLIPVALDVGLWARTRPWEISQHGSQRWGTGRFRTPYCSKHGVHCGRTPSSGGLDVDLVMELVTMSELTAASDDPVSLGESPHQCLAVSPQSRRETEISPDTFRSRKPLGAQAVPHLSTPRILPARPTFPMCAGVALAVLIVRRYGIRREPRPASLAGVPRAAGGIDAGSVTGGNFRVLCRSFAGFIAGLAVVKVRPCGHTFFPAPIRLPLSLLRRIGIHLDGTAGHHRTLPSRRPPTPSIESGLLRARVPLPRTRQRSLRRALSGQTA